MSNYNQLSLSKRVKTISWKFREVGRSYPDLKGVIDKNIRSPIAFFSHFKFLFDYEVKEKFIVFWLNTANKVIGYEIVSEGTLSSSVVHPREVFRGAIVSSCACIIIAHNHPSGSIKPSPMDITLTNRLIEAGSLVGIQILDHIIFTNKSYLSFLEGDICKFASRRYNCWS